MSVVLGREAWEMLLGVDLPFQDTGRVGLGRRGGANMGPLPRQYGQKRRSLLGTRWEGSSTVAPWDTWRGRASVICWP